LLVHTLLSLTISLHHRSQGLSKAEKKKLNKPTSFPWFLKTDSRVWHFVCSDATERDRWISNVRAADKRPFARFCYGCLAHPCVPSSTQYVISGPLKCLAGPHAGSAVFVVVARGHGFVFASSTQHELDRSRVLPNGVIHLHGAVISRPRKGLWQVTTPNDAVVRQFEVVPKSAATAEAEFDEWMAALRREQHVPEGEEPPTSIDGRRVAPEDVDVSALRKVLYRSESVAAETQSYRQEPKSRLVDKRVSLASLGAGPRSAAIDMALGVDSDAYGDSPGSSPVLSTHKDAAKRSASRKSSSRTGARSRSKGDVLSSSMPLASTSPTPPPATTPPTELPQSPSSKGSASPKGSPHLARSVSLTRSSGTHASSVSKVSSSPTIDMRVSGELKRSGVASPRSSNSSSPRGVSPRTLLPSSPKAHRVVKVAVESSSSNGVDSNDDSDSSAEAAPAATFQAVFEEEELFYEADRGSRKNGDNGGADDDDYDDDTTQANDVVLPGAADDDDDDDDESDSGAAANDDDDEVDENEIDSDEQDSMD
jgi:hypothetical protein